MAATTLTSEALIDQLGSQPNQRALTTFLRRQEQLWDPAVVERLYERVVRVARSDLRQAGRLADAAMWLAGKLEDDCCRAQSLRAMGHVLLIRGKYSEALERYDGARELFRTLGREVDLGRTLSGGVLQSLICLGRYEEAFTAARQARAIFERHGDRLRLARLDSNLGNILYRQDRFQEAIALYERAHEQLARVGEPQDVAAVLSNMAVCYTSLNEFQKALKAYHDAREYCLAHDMPLLVAQADYNIAYLYYLRGDTHALDLFRAAQGNPNGPGRLPQRALRPGPCGDLSRLNLSDEVLELANRALTGFDKLGMAYEAAKALTSLAIAASHERDSRRARKLFRDARGSSAERKSDLAGAGRFHQALLLYRDGKHAQARRAVPERARAVRANRCREKRLVRVAAGAPGSRGWRSLPPSRPVARRCRGRGDAFPDPELSAYFVLGLIHEAQHEQRSSRGIRRRRVPASNTSQPSTGRRSENRVPERQARHLRGSRVDLSRARIDRRATGNRVRLHRAGEVPKPRRSHRVPRQRAGAADRERSR